MDMLREMPSTWGWCSIRTACWVAKIFQPHDSGEANGGLETSGGKAVWLWGQQGVELTEHRERMTMQGSPQG